MNALALPLESAFYTCRWWRPSLQRSEVLLREAIDTEIAETWRYLREHRHGAALTTVHVRGFFRNRDGWPVHECTWCRQQLGNIEDLFVLRHTGLD